ncbi:hypothetical protein [Candidatus Ferrigenium straubiae]
MNDPEKEIVEHKVRRAAGMSAPRTVSRSEWRVTKPAETGSYWMGVI